MNVFGQIVSEAFGGVNQQIEQAKSEAQIIASAVAVWGVIIAVELGVLIYLSGKGKKG